MAINLNHLVLMSVCLASYLGSAQLQILLGMLKQHKRVSFERFLLEQFYTRALKFDSDGLWNAEEIQVHSKLDALVRAIEQAFDGNSTLLAKIADTQSATDTVPAAVRGMISLIDEIDKSPSNYIRYWRNVHNLNFQTSYDSGNVYSLLGDYSWEVILITAVLAGAGGNLLAEHFGYMIMNSEKIDREVFRHEQLNAFWNFRNATLGYQGLSEDVNSITYCLYLKVVDRLKSSFSGVTVSFSHDDDYGHFSINGIPYLFGGFFHLTQMAMKRDVNGKGAFFEIPKADTGTSGEAKFLEGVLKYCKSLP